MEYVRELDTRAAGTAATQSALKVHRLTFMEAAMLVVGSTIGSGVLGLAYASRLAWRLSIRLARRSRDFFRYFHAVCRGNSLADTRAVAAFRPG